MTSQYQKNAKYRGIQYSYSIDFKNWYQPSLGAWRNLTVKFTTLAIKVNINTHCHRSSYHVPLFGALLSRRRPHENFLLCLGAKNAPKRKRSKRPLPAVVCCSRMSLPCRISDLVNSPLRGFVSSFSAKWVA